jgi:hypothetical protein
LYNIVFEEGAGHWLHAPAGGGVKDAGEPDLHVPVVSQPDTTDTLPGLIEPEAGESTTPDAVTTVEPRHSGHMHTPSKVLLDSRNLQAEEAAAKAACEPWAVSTTKKKSRAVAALTTTTVSVPQSYQEAMRHPEVWTAPTQKEYTMLVSRETWDLVDKHEHC